MKKVRVKVLKNEKWQIKNELVFGDYLAIS